MTTATLSEGRQETAATGEGRQWAASYSVPNAADELGIPIRTLRDWIQAGKLHTIDPTPPQRGRRIPSEEMARLWAAAAAERSEGRHQAATISDRRQEAAEGEGRRQNEAATVESDRLNLNGARHDMSPNAAGPELLALRAQLAAADRERETLAGMVDHLQAQVDARTAAERELRVMLARLEATNAELAGALVQKALPPAPEEIAATVEPPRRVRWYWPFARRG